MVFNMTQALKPGSPLNKNNNMLIHAEGALVWPRVRGQIPVKSVSQNWTCQNTL